MAFLMSLQHASSFLLPRCWYQIFNSLQQILNDKFMWDGKRLAILTRFTIEEVCFKKNGHQIPFRMDTIHRRNIELSCIFGTVSFKNRKFNNFCQIRWDRNRREKNGLSNIYLKLAFATQSKTSSVKLVSRMFDSNRVLLMFILFRPKSTSKYLFKSLNNIVRFVISNQIQWWVIIWALICASFVCLFAFVFGFGQFIHQPVQAKRSRQDVLGRNDVQISFVLTS